MKSKKVIIFTYYWPPAGGVGVQRFLKLSKFLPESGWEPIIITVKNGSYPFIDKELLNEVSPLLRVYRTKTFEPFRIYNFLRGKKGKSVPTSVVATSKKSFFQITAEFIRANLFVPDARKGWMPYALKQAKEIIDSEKIDAFITAGPPHSTHLIGLRLKEKYNIPWIADMEDPWTDIFNNDFLLRSVSTKEQDSKLEKQVLLTADKIIVTCPNLQRKFSHIANNVDVIYNGFDPDDFAQNGIRNQPEIFTIRYIGTFLAHHDVRNLWKAFAEIKNRGIPFIIEFIGQVDDQVKESINKEGLSDSVKYRGFVSHKDATRLAQEASLLLFIVIRLRGNDKFINAKLYEYLASTSQIISLGPPDSHAAEILSQAQRPAMIHYSNYDFMLKQLLSFIEFRRKTGFDFKYTFGQYQLFNKRNQAHELAMHLDNLQNKKKILPVIRRAA